ncbi:MAG TPA: hypothetical protein PLR49_02455, partial [Deltaproteobacteria bacterium]|nr:hypothetical protein [Deltaproteobacteria bacterium]
KAGKMKDRVAVVHIADSLARAFGVGSGGDGWVCPVSESAWDLVGMTGIDLPVLMRKILADLEEVDNYKL